MRGYSSEIILGLVATLLVVYGETLIKLFKAQIRPYNFVLRLLCLVLVSAVVFTILTQICAHVLAEIFTLFPDEFFSVFVILLFLGIGVIADKKKYM